MDFTPIATLLEQATAAGFTTRAQVQPLKTAKGTLLMIEISIYDGNPWAVFHNSYILTETITPVILSVIQDFTDLITKFLNA